MPNPSDSPRREPSPDPWALVKDIDELRARVTSLEDFILKIKEMVYALHDQTKILSQRIDLRRLKETFNEPNPPV